MKSFYITKVEAWPVTLPLRASFVVATGAMDVAQNLYVRVTLQSGTVGYGEVAPFPDISGEDQASSLEEFPQAARLFVGQSAIHYRRLFSHLREVIPVFPALRCGIETAVLDALTREMNVPLWGFWGGKDVRARETDVTLPIGEIGDVVTTATDWYRRGFRQLKMKVGQEVEADIRRVEAVARACPEAAFVIDANQGFSFEQAQHFLSSLEKMRIPVLVMEQPLHRDRIEELVALQRQARMPLAADESLRSLADALELIRLCAVEMFNIKITKCGVLDSLAIIGLAQASGMGLMIGGMVESRVAMGCSWSIVLGLGGFSVLDLDMPLLLAVDPVEGGYQYEGPQLHVDTAAGLGMELPSPPSSSLCSVD